MVPEMMIGAAALSDKIPPDPLTNGGNCGRAFAGSVDDDACALPLDLDAPFTRPPLTPLAKGGKSEQELDFAVDLPGGGKLGAERGAQDVFDADNGRGPSFGIDLHQRSRGAIVDQRGGLLWIVEVEALEGGVDESSQLFGGAEIGEGCGNDRFRGFQQCAPPWPTLTKGGRCRAAGVGIAGLRARLELSVYRLNFRDAEPPTGRLVGCKYAQRLGKRIGRGCIEQFAEAAKARARGPLSVESSIACGAD